MQRNRRHQVASGEARGVSTNAQVASIPWGEVGTQDGAAPLADNITHVNREQQLHGNELPPGGMRPKRSRRTNPPNMRTVGFQPESSLAPSVPPTTAGSWT
jgi:hypothetical protein